MGMTIFTDRVLAGILREKVGASEFACAAANLAADRIEQLVATNEQLVMERDTIREAALREAAALCDWYPYVEGVRTAIYELMGVKVCS